MAITISIGMEKGGVGKTTTAAILSFLLAKQGKVLAIDLDAQGDLSKFLSRKDKEEFEGITVYEACSTGEAVPFIHEITESLHLLPADDQIFMAFDTIDYQALKRVIDTVSGVYDYVVIDMPPQLSKQVLAGLYASDLTVCVTLAEPMSYQKIDNYLELVEEVKTEATSLQLAGILITSFDPRTSIDMEYQEAMEQKYPSQLFKTVIKKRARIKEFSHFGIQDRTVADRKALDPYKELLKELITRWQGKF